MVSPLEPLLAIEILPGDLLLLFNLRCVWLVFDEYRLWLCVAAPGWRRAIFSREFEVLSFRAPFKTFTLSLVVLASVFDVVD